MKPLVIYHANCADGYGAAFAAWLKLGENAEYRPTAYGEVNTDHNFIDTFGWVDGRNVYILDFSFPKEVMDQIFRRAKRVVWLDHHKTAFEMWCPGETTYHSITGPDHNITLDNNKSGAYLAWEYFHPGTEVPMLIQHIDDYDRWQFKLEGTKEINKGIWSYTPWTFSQWEVFVHPKHSGLALDECRGEGAAILRAHDQNVKSVLKSATRTCAIDTNSVDIAMSHRRSLLAGLAANCPSHLTSDVGHELATLSGTYGLCWSMRKDGKISCSLRSNGDYDVSAIARTFGGGGHRNAAGFETTIEELLEWLR